MKTGGENSFNKCNISFFLSLQIFDETKSLHVHTKKTLQIKLGIHTYDGDEEKLETYHCDYLNV